MTQKNKTAGKFPPPYKMPKLTIKASSKH